MTKFSFVRPLLLALAVGVVALPRPLHAEPGGAMALAMAAGTAGLIIGSMSGETMSLRDEVQGIRPTPRNRNVNKFDVSYPVYQPTAFVPANTPPAAVYSSVPPHRPHTEDLYNSQMMVYVPHHGR